MPLLYFYFLFFFLSDTNLILIKTILTTLINILTVLTSTTLITILTIFTTLQIHSNEETNAYITYLQENT